MRRHHYATDSSGKLHVFHTPASRNGWVYTRARQDPRARALSAAQARNIIGGPRFLRLREAAHERHTMLDPEEAEDGAPTAGGVPMTHTLGQPYEGRPGTRAPHNMLTWDYGTLNLALFIHRPSELETVAFQELTPRVGVHLEEPVLWLLFDLPAIHIADAPFTPHLVPPEARHFPQPTTPKTRYPLTVVMADAATGMIKALRYATLSPSISQQMHGATAALLHRPFDNGEYHQAVNDMYTRHPDPSSMLRLPPVMDDLGA